MWQNILAAIAGASIASALLATEAILDSNVRASRSRIVEATGVALAFSFIAALCAALIKWAFADAPIILVGLVGAAIPVVTRLAMRMSVYSPVDSVRQGIDLQVARRQPVVINVAEGATVESISGLIPDTEAERVSDSIEKQEAILREMYTHGLAQARTSFRVSVVFACVGSGIMFFGIGLAVWNAPTTGNQYASIIATTAGVVINLTSSLFYVQSNRARRSMLEQGALMREESRDDRRLNGARELAAAISDEGLRNSVRARLAVILLSDGPARVRPSGDEMPVEDAGDGSSSTSDDPRPTT